MLLGGTAACSSDSDSKSADKSSSATDAKSGSTSKSESGSTEGRPDGFPDDVPLPEFEDVSVIQSATDDSPGSWSLVLTIDPTLKETSEDLMAAYGAQLEEAGFELDDPTSNNVEAVNDKWTVFYHSAMDGTLTIGTSPN